MSAQANSKHGLARDVKRRSYSTTIVNQVVETRQSLLTEQRSGRLALYAGREHHHSRLRAVLCAPMLVHDRLIGVVYVDTTLRSGSFSEADRGLLSAVAGQAGIAIEMPACTGWRWRKAVLSKSLRWRGRFE